MAIDKTKQFSEYEVDQISFVLGTNDIINETCIGSMAEQMESKTVVKKCRGVEVKSVTRGTGKGTVDLSLHIKAYVVRTLAGMYGDDTLKDGIVAYGQSSVHPEIMMLAHVTDEDGNEKYKAYPVCTLASKPKDSTENGAEEVAELAISLNVTPDDYGNGMYEAFDEDVPSGITWMTSFTPELAHTTA